jgi:hypothetical protein
MDLVLDNFRLSSNWVALGMLLASPSARIDAQSRTISVARSTALSRNAYGQQVDGAFRPRRSFTTLSRASLSLEQSSLIVRSLSYENPVVGVFKAIESSAHALTEALRLLITADLVRSQTKSEAAVAANTARISNATVDLEIEAKLVDLERQKEQLNRDRTENKLLDTELKRRELELHGLEVEIESRSQRTVPAIPLTWAEKDEVEAAARRAIANRRTEVVQDIFEVRRFIVTNRSDENVVEWTQEQVSAVIDPKTLELIERARAEDVRTEPVPDR